MRKDVLKFVSRFTSDGKFDQVKTTFTSGCCYWFAFVLLCRFPDDSRIVYDEVENHFATEIDGKVYDITGEITGKYNMRPWTDLQDDLLRDRIYRDCILF